MTRTGRVAGHHYFFRADPKDLLDKLSADVMHNQVQITTRLLAMMDRLSPTRMKGEAREPAS